MQKNVNINEVRIWGIVRKQSVWGEAQVALSTLFENILFSTLFETYPWLRKSSGRLDIEGIFPRSLSSSLFYWRQPCHEKTCRCGI